MKVVFISALLLAVIMPATSQVIKPVWTIVKHPIKQQADILYNGKLITSYCYYDSVMKPVLFPIITTSGVTITRGYPIATRPGDHPDHRHHTGLWMNYEYVNGLDFWNNSTAIPFDKRKGYGTIVHKKIISSAANEKHAMLETSADWRSHDGIVLLKESTTYRFQTTATELVIDRFTTLAATDSMVRFNDVKDGFLGLRVASELEMPSKSPLELVDTHGNITKVEGGGTTATGMYHSSAGLEGDSVWGTRGRWCALTGSKDGHDIIITIIDHPLNPGYPTYWHARGYGLFAANPLGQAVFTNEKKRLNFKLRPQQSIHFRYRIVIASDAKFDPKHINALADAFGKTLK